MTTDPIRPGVIVDRSLGATNAKLQRLLRPGRRTTWRSPVTPDPFDPYHLADDSAAPAPSSPYVGPFDREPFPDRLTARVVEPGPDARIHGYHVAGDLARHAGMADVVWLAL